MHLTLETHSVMSGIHAATLELKDDTSGFQDASNVDYHLDYFVTVASAKFSAGKRSGTIAPCQSDTPSISKTDIAPAGRPSSWILRLRGHARRKLAEYLTLA